MFRQIIQHFFYSNFLNLTEFLHKKKLKERVQIGSLDSYCPDLMKVEIKDMRSFCFSLYK